MKRWEDRGDNELEEDGELLEQDPLYLERGIPDEGHFFGEFVRGFEKGVSIGWSMLTPPTEEELKKMREVPLTKAGVIS